MIAALSDLRAGTSSWIPGGNQVKGEGKKPEKAQVMMQGLWTPFLLNFLTGSATDTTFVAPADTATVSDLMFFAYRGFMSWSPRPNASKHTQETLFPRTEDFSATPVRRERRASGLNVVCYPQNSLGTSGAERSRQP